jgi:hypothetical protein
VAFRRPKHPNLKKRKEEKKMEAAGGGSSSTPRQKKKRKRKNPNWKPYNKMTWEEKKALEDKKRMRAEGDSHISAIPTSKSGRIKKGVAIQDFRPQAPNNPSEVGEMYLIMHGMLIAHAISSLLSNRSSLVMN